MQAGARRVNDNNVVGGDEVESFFTGSEDSAGIGAPESGDVALHFSDGGLIDFDERGVIAADSQPDRTDASVKVNYREVLSAGVIISKRCTFWIGNPLLHITQSLLVHGYVYLKKSLTSIAEWRAKNRIGECGNAKFCEACGDAASWTAWVRIDDFPALRG